MTTSSAEPGASGDLALPAEVRAFLDSNRRYATLATINPDGSSHQALTWYLLVGDTLVVNSREGRRWPSNLRRDPRISLTVADGRHWVSLRGTAEVVDDLALARADIAAMARWYNEDGTAEQDIETTFSHQERVSFRLRPSAIHAELGEG